MCDRSDSRWPARLTLSIVRAFVISSVAVSSVAAQPGNAQPTDTATYSVRFQATWSEATHPDPGFPSNPHFSGLIGAVHNNSAQLWRAGGVASAGMERMAEIGATSPLDAEVEALIATGQAREVIRGGGIAVSPGAVATTFTVSRRHPQVTLVSMLAPSPDWFVGVSALDLFTRGDWIEGKTVFLRPWDAGTDSGPSYTSRDQDTRPRASIQPLEGGPFAGNDTPVGFLTFTRLDSPEPAAMLLNDGRFRISAEWQDFDLTRRRAHPVSLTEDTGFFWFFNENNVEAVVKIIDGCTFNERFWVFAGGLTNVEMEITVEDTETGQVNVYANPLGNPFQPIQDSNAFTTCP